MNCGKRIQSIEEWQQIRDTSDSDILILKISPICPISKGVERRVDRWVDSQEHKLPVQVIKVDVISARSLSHHLAGELGISHQSPQAIWFTPPDTVRWHASHHRITGAALDTQLTEARTRRS